MLATARRRYSRANPFRDGNLSTLTCRQVFNLARNNDPIATAVVSDIVEMPGTGIVNLCNTLGPDKILRFAQTSLGKSGRLYGGS